MELGVELR